MNTPETLARAFNSGCDARLAGKTKRAQPYRRNTPDGAALAEQWLAGWIDVDQHWGNAVARSVQELPVARGGKA